MTPRAGMRALSGPDQPGSVGLVGQVELARQLPRRTAFALRVVLIDRRLSGLLAREQHLVHGLADPMAERESDFALAGRICQVVAGAGGIRLGEDVALNRALGQLLRRQMRQLEVTDKAADA